MSQHAGGDVAAATSRTADPNWWKTAIFYQIYPRSFADSNGDGVGDLNGVTDRLDYLAELGVDALWLSPFYRSPMADHGYDVSDPTDVDPLFGTLADFDRMTSEAHARGMKVTVDLVPNHFSDRHVWFQQALAAGPGSAERERFLFRDGVGPDGSQPPNNWVATFGGPAWTRVEDGQWYLHLFTPEQPDLNWENPEVPAEFERIIRFWLARGVDGFRIDVAHGMAKPDGLADMVEIPQVNRQLDDDPRFDQPRVHAYLRGMRAVLDEYPGAMAVGEVWVPTAERLAKYVRADELHLTFNFGLVQAIWNAEEFRREINEALKASEAVGAPATWVLSNHDIIRHVTRYGGGTTGRARGRAAAMVQFALPGAAFLYNGDELGLENVDIPDDALQDPVWERSGHTERGRDAERVPMPWSGTSAPYGFTSGTPWLPMPEDWAAVTVEAQSKDAESFLSLYRQLLRLRRTTPELQKPGLSWVDAPALCLAFRRGENVVVVVNFGEVPAELPVGEVIVASAPLKDGLLPADAAVWLRTS